MTNEQIAKPVAVWERPALVRMDAADAKNGAAHHTDQFNFRRNVGS